MTNFRKFQCCTNCKFEFVKAREYRKKCRYISFPIVLVLVALLTFILVTRLSASSGRRKHRHSEANLAQQVLEGEQPMSIAISKLYGKRAHELTNQAR